MKPNTLRKTLSKPAEDGAGRTEPAAEGTPLLPSEHASSKSQQRVLPFSSSRSLVRDSQSPTELPAIPKSTSVHFSSTTDEWPTPQALFEELSRIFGGFTLDPCATAQNAKCPRYFTRAENGLTQSWTGKVFMNPPYGRQIGAWVRKAWEESERGALVVCLLPARVDTRWWHDYARKGYIHFLRGRLKFGQASASAPFPSAVVTFGKFFNG